MGKIIEISGFEYSALFKLLGVDATLHGCWTESESGSQMTAWSVKGRNEWVLKFCTTNGVHSYYKRKI